MRRKLPQYRACLVAVSVLLAASGFATAGDDIDHNEALRLFKEGRILSLTEITTAVRDKVPGEVIEVELEREDGIYVYEFKILRPNGRVQEVEVDAATKKILKIEDDD